MDAITALHSRNSSARLTEPAPRGSDREAIFQAALRSPDHAGLKPWRFLLYEDESRLYLGESMLSVALREEPLLAIPAQEKLRVAPLRAPLVIVVVAKVVEHPKVPEIEQLLSAGAAATQMLLAAHALGYAGIWRTGAIAYNLHLPEVLSLAAGERIIGFLYLGTADGRRKTLSALQTQDYFESR